MENFVIFYHHLVYFRAIGSILWPYGIFCGNLVYFSPFCYFGPRKIWQPWSGSYEVDIFCNFVDILKFCNLVFGIVGQIHQGNAKKEAVGNSPLISSTKKVVFPISRGGINWLLFPVHERRERGCQICLDTIYQNGGKYTKLPPNQQCGLKIYQMSVIFTKGP
jgi:hypothetical protein